MLDHIDQVAAERKVKGESERRIRHRRDLRDDRNRALGIVGLAAVILAMHACTGTDDRVISGPSFR
jgi:hypothetical protein